MNQKKLDFLKNLARGIISIFGNRCEVVVHDFTDLRKSLVYILGGITKRSLGAPIPDMVYRLLKDFGDDAPDKFGSKITTEDGRILKCSTNMLRDDEGKLEGCICINFDVTDFAFLSTAFNDFTFIFNRDAADGPKTFAGSMESTIDFAIVECGKVPAVMDRADKLAVMRKLDQGGVFMIKGSVDYIARVFGLSRYTIYNYLKQVRGKGQEKSNIDDKKDSKAKNRIFTAKPYRR